MAHGEGHRGQCSGFAGTLELPRGEQPPGLLVPEVRCCPAREREPTGVLRPQVGLAPEGAQRLLQHRGSRRVALGDHGCQTLEQEIGWPRPRRTGRPCERELADLHHAGPAGQPAGEAGCGEGFQVGRARQLRVDRLERTGGLEQERRRVAAAPLGERDLRAQEIHVGGLHVAAGAHLGEQGDRVAERAGFVLGLRRRQRALRTAPGIEGQRGRALQERRSGRQAATRLGPVGRPRQVGGDALVGGGRRLGQVPCAPVGIDLGVRRARQRPVRPPPFLRRCRSVDRGAGKRMAEAHPGTDLQQPSRLDRLQRHARDRQPLGCAPHQRRIAGGIGPRDDQEPLSVLWQRSEPLREALLDPTGHGHSARQSEAAGQLRRRELPGQLQQRQRVAPGLAQELIRHALVQPPGDRRGQKGARIGILQSLDHQLGHAREFVARVARDEQHHHRLREQPPRHEHQRLR